MDGLALGLHLSEFLLEGNNLHFKVALIHLEQIVVRFLEQLIAGANGLELVVHFNLVVLHALVENLLLLLFALFCTASASLVLDHLISQPFNSLHQLGDLPALARETLVHGN